MTQAAARAAATDLTEQEKVDLLASATERMAEYTFPCVASILRVDDDDTGTFLGSAWRVASRGLRAIVTAAHVIDEAAASGRGVAVSAQRGAAPYMAPAEEWARSAGDDLAVWRAPEEYGRGNGVPPIDFWPEAAIDLSAKALRTDFLFVHGFPQRRSRFSPLLGGVSNTSLPYGAMVREEPLQGVRLGEHEFALHFEASGLVPANGTDATFVLPHGLSGSGVWRLDIGGRSSSSWAPELARLVGVVLRWVPDEQALVVVHAERALALLRAALPST